MICDWLDNMVGQGGLQRQIRGDDLPPMTNQDHHNAGYNEAIHDVAGLVDAYMRYCTGHTNYDRHGAKIVKVVKALLR